MATHTGALDHTTVLNLLLSHACPVDDATGDTRTFRFDLHCKEVEIEARLVSTFRTIQYEILTVRDVE